MLLTVIADEQRAAIPESADQELTRLRRLPIVSGNAAMARADALAAYASNDRPIAQGTARYVADLLRGANPAELYGF